MPIAGLEVGLPATIDDVDAAWLTAVLRTSGAIDPSTAVSAASVEPFQVGVGRRGILDGLAELPPRLAHLWKRIP